MDFDELLKEKKCSCGKTHSCEIKKVLISEGAINGLLPCVGERSHVIVVADENTYQTCGDKVCDLLAAKLELKLIYKRNGLLVPDETAVAELRALVSGKTDLILGIGSGVIQDICKYVSFNASLPYGIIATAPSMDGYASSGAAMIMNNMKVTYTAHVPEFIIGDVNVLKTAPTELIQSGYGDILGKYSCLNDWRLSAVVNGEYFCDEIYGLTFDMMIKTQGLGKALLERDPAAIQTLTEALVGVGIAMALAGNSRPASGSEHHLSHFFEIVGILNGEPYFLHGIDVLYSAVCTAELREKLLSVETLEKASDFDRISWEESIRKIYTKAADGVIELQDKVGRYQKDDIAVYREKWNEIKAVLSEAPTKEEMLGYVSDIGLDFAQFEERYGREKLENAIWFAKDLKDRYTVLWLYYTLFYKG